MFVLDWFDVIFCPVVGVGTDSLLICVKTCLLNPEQHFVNDTIISLQNLQTSRHLISFLHDGFKD